MGLGGVAIAVPPYVIHPKTAVLGRAGGGKTVQTIAHFFDINQKITNKTRIFMHFVPRNR